MGLETIVSGFERYSGIKSLADGLSERGQDPVVRAQIYQQLGGFIKKYEPAGASGVDPIIEDIITNERNTLAGQMIGEQISVSQGMLLEQISAEYKGLIQAIDPKKLTQIIMSLDKNMSKYSALANEVQNGNFDNAKAEFVKYYAEKECPTIAKYISRISEPEMIKRYAEIFLKNAADKLNKELSDEVEVDTPKGKKKTYVANADKIRKYLLNKIESTKEKDRANVYLTLAGTYAESQAKKK